MMLFLLVGWAFAGSGSDPADVTREVASGVHVNWTRLVLEASTSASSAGTESTRAIEELARREIQLGMEQGAGRLRVADGTLAELYEDPRIGRAVRSRISRWEVTEARYHASGRVELVAELSLQELMRPWTVTYAREPSAGRIGEPEHTGMVVDTRGLDLQITWSPRLVSADGTVLHEATLWEEDAVSRSPGVYVSDPAHPAASRAGENPLFLRAIETRGRDLVLSVEDAERFREILDGARLLGEGALVVVTDP